MRVYLKARTRMLLAVLVLVVLVELFPEHAGVIKAAWVGAGAVYGLVWAVARLREKSVHAARLSADEREYRAYRIELDELRARYDADRDLSDPTAIAPEYRDALSALHDRYEAMLDRKFGPRS